MSTYQPTEQETLLEDLLRSVFCDTHEFNPGKYRSIEASQVGVSLQVDLHTYHSTKETIVLHP